MSFFLAFSIQFGVRMQGIHDILAQFLGPAGTRQKRSLDILSYIFGTTNEEEKLQTGKFKYAVGIHLYWMNFDSGKKNEIQHRSQKDHIRMTLFS